MKSVQDILRANPRVIFTGDNLPVLRGMNSETADLIYLDPPFNSGKQWANPVEAAGRRAMAEFKDTWETSDIHIDERYALGLEYPQAVAVIDALAEVNGDSWKAYLIYMGVRIAEMRRILKPAGSIYYHCDPVMSHGVKLLMDAIFGGGHKGGNFRNEIVWHYQAGTSKKNAFGRRHDVILHYAKGKNNAFNRQGKPVINPARYKKVDADGRRYDVNGQGKRYYLDEGQTCDDVWTYVQEKQFQQINSQSKEKTGYPTQKPLALLERIVKASSNPDGIVLDPFCGCATTCLAAERLGRHWIGVDLSEQTAKLVVDRLRKESDRVLVSAAEAIQHLRKPPQRTDLQGKRSKDAVIKMLLHRRQGGVCPGCDRPVDSDFMDLDHIIARSRGGQDIDDNLQLLCRNCNVMKGDKGMDALRKKVLIKRAEREMQEWRARQEAKRKKESQLEE